MVYFQSTEEEHLTSTTPERYRNRWREQRTDHTNNIPWKKQEHFPKSGNEGLYGFTFRHDGKIHIREDLIEDQRLETIIHESILKDLNNRLFSLGFSVYIEGQ